MTPGPTKDLVLRLRAIRDELRLSISDIVTKLEEAKTPLSESTVRRVLDHDLDDISGFNYEASLMPIADILLPKGDAKDKSLAEEKIRALNDIIEIKNKTIADRDRTIETMTKQFSDAEERQKSRCAKCADDVSFLKAQIALKDARMDKKDEWIDRLLGHIEEMLHAPADRK